MSPRSPGPGFFDTLCSLFGRKNKEAPAASGAARGMHDDVSASAPHPRDLAQVDLAAREVNERLLVLGKDTVPFLATIHRKTGGQKLDVDPTDGEPTDEPSYSYLSLSLGEIRGWHTRIHLFGFPDDERLADHIRVYLQQVDAIVIAQGTGDVLDPTVREAAMFVGSLEGEWPIAVLGSEALAAQWRSITDTAPLLVAPFATDSVFPALKVVAKAVLQTLRGSA